MFNPTNAVIVTGHLAAAPKIFKKENGATIKFTVYAASGNSKYGDDRVEFTAFTKADKLGIYQYLSKGDRVSVGAHLTTSAWTRKNGETRYDLVAIVDSLRKLDSKRESEARASREQAAPAEQAQAPAAPVPAAPVQVTGEQIPMTFDSADFE